MKNYYSNKISSVIILMIFFAPLLLSQTETIPWIPLSKDAPENIPGRKNAIITSSQIGVPIYPGAYLTSYYPANSSNESGETVSITRNSFSCINR